MILILLLMRLINSACVAMTRIMWSSMLILVCVTLSSVPSIRPVHSTTVEVNFQARVAKDAAASGKRVIVVDQSGAGDFKTINEALDAVPLHNKNPITIKVHPGIYVELLILCWPVIAWGHVSIKELPRHAENFSMVVPKLITGRPGGRYSWNIVFNIERVVVPKSKSQITLQGAGRDVTKITSGIAAVETGTTYTTSTFGVSAPAFTARNISFENSSPRPGGVPQQQAVALRTTGDFNAFYGCAFYGQQDTLYDDRGRHYFKDCLIAGSVDFIFGNGKSLYENCELRVLSTSGGSLTAQKRSDPNEDTGFSFVNCKVTGKGAATVYLGRAWGAYSRVVFAFTEIAGIINPVGWYSWGDTAVEGTVFYGQHRCFGPGANESGRAAWSHELTDAEVAPFVSLNYIDGGLWVG